MIPGAAIDFYPLYTAARTDSLLSPLPYSMRRIVTIRINSFASSLPSIQRQGNNPLGANDISPVVVVVVVFISLS